MFELIIYYNIDVIIEFVFKIYYHYYYRRNLFRLKLIINYKIRKYKINRKHISLVFIALRYRFLKKKNNVTNVFYIFDINISLTSHFFNTI